MHPTALEVASGCVLGAEPGVRPLPPARHLVPRVALEAAIEPALARGPCLVSFSGGRDSSLVLAVATDVARRRGLPLPVPVTMRFPGVPEADESCWQELVVGHLRLPDWIRHEYDDELDLIGPLARRVLSTHGLLDPANAYFHTPMLEDAAGGTLLTGFGGDDVFREWRWNRPAGVLARRLTPRPRDVLRVSFFASPRFVQRPVFRRRIERQLLLPWLRPSAQAAVQQRWLAELESHPRSFERYIHWLAARRFIAVTCRSLGLLAYDAGATIEHPLLEAGFLASIARAGGVLGFGDRSATMQGLFARVLPDAVLTRGTKAFFAAALKGPHTRRFIDSWTGEGLDRQLVDEDALRATWAAREPDGRSVLLLQSVWLAATGGRPAPVTVIAPNQAR